MAELFVMVRGIPHVWRLVRYDNFFLFLEPPNSHEVTAALKTLCRVGEASDWRRSSFADVWAAGGGESFVEAAR